MALDTVPSRSRAFWNRREDVGAEAPKPAPVAKPAPVQPRTPEDVAKLTRNEEAFRAFLGQDDPFAHGFRRTLQYISARRHEFDNDDDFATVVSKFVDQYPTSVRQVDPEYWSGMKAARDSFRSLPRTFGGA